MKGNDIMFKIVTKRELNPTVTLMEIEAPFVAKKAEPGQFIILRVDEDGERIPLTPSAIFLPLRTSAATRKSSILPFVHEPI